MSSKNNKILMAVPKGVLSEDQAYLLGFLKSHFPDLMTLRYDRYTDVVDPPPDDFGLLVQLLSIRNPQVLNSLAKVAQDANAAMSNPPDAVLEFDDKRTLSKHFARHIPITKTIHSLDAAIACFNDWGRDMVAKPPTAGRGENIYRIRSEADFSDLSRLIDMTRETGAVVQPYYGGFGVGDQRVFLIRDPDGTGRIFANFYRVPPEHGWMSNLSQGGAMISKPLQKDEIALSLEVFNTSGLDFAGLDIGRHDGRAMLIEINSTAGGLIDYDFEHRTNSQSEIAAMLAHRLENRDRYVPIGHHGPAFATTHPRTGPLP